MSKAEALDQLSRGALAEIASWLELLSRITDDRRGWLKANYVEVLARKLAVEQVNSLNDCVQAGSPYFREEDLVRILGLPPKTVIARWLKRDELHEIMERLDRQGRVQMAWRSLSVGNLQDYLIRKLSAEELALEAGLITTGQATRPQALSKLVAEPKANDVLEVVTSPLKRPPARDGVFMWIDEVITYLAQGEFVRELLAQGHLGDTEATLQAEMFRLIKPRLGEPFRIECNKTLDDNRRPDIVISHVQGQIAIEIKPNGSAKGLLDDIAKLRRYLRRTSAAVMFGFIVYRSPRTEHADVVRAVGAEPRLRLLRIPA